MEHNRTIKPKFCDDVKIGKLSRDARLLYIQLWLFADDIGVVIGDIVWLKSKMFPYDKIQIQQFEKWMNELVTNGFICLLSYNGERFIYLPNFTRHQVINKINSEDLNIPKQLIDKSKDNIHTLIAEQLQNKNIPFAERTALEIEEECYMPTIPNGTPSAEDKINYKALMDTFNSIFKGKLPKVTAMTEKRKQAVKARASEHGKESIMTVFHNVAKSAFLLGNNNNNWKCGFDWIFKPTNFIKILEGSYNRERVSSWEADAVLRRTMEQERERWKATAVTREEYMAMKGAEHEEE